MTAGRLSSFDDAFTTPYPIVTRTAGLVARDAQVGQGIAQEAFVPSTSGGIA